MRTDGTMISSSHPFFPYGRKVLFKGRKEPKKENCIAHSGKKIFTKF
jgi:hypothetical protein